MCVTKAASNVNVDDMYYKMAGFFSSRFLSSAYLSFVYSNLTIIELKIEPVVNFVIIQCDVIFVNLVALFEHQLFV